ncbi:MAG TPA: ferrous iron transport protein A [Clostridiales bacterium]|nr:ferrous iron transport protein A [Clostridiales bacterium]
METTADKIKIGQKTVVKALACKGALRRRIIDMGIIPGVQIILRKRAPFGDPLEFIVRGYRLCIRKSEACQIIVSTEGDR